MLEQTKAWIAVIIAITFVVVAFTLIVVMVIALRSCSFANNEIVFESVSPGAEYKAVIFTRDAGATTQTSYQLSVIKNGKKLSNNSGNVFISYSKIDIEWKDETTLLVTIYGNETIFKQEEKIGAVVILYKREPGK